MQHIKKTLLPIKKSVFLFPYSFMENMKKNCLHLNPISPKE